MKRLFCALLCAILWPATACAQRPDLSGNWILNGGTTTFGEWHLTDEGARRFKAYDFKKDDSSLKCIGSSWTRVWLNPNVLVRITQLSGSVGLQYEWMDIDRRIPLVDPGAARPTGSRSSG